MVPGSDYLKGTGKNIQLIGITTGLDYYLIDEQGPEDMASIQLSGSFFRRVWMSNSLPIALIN